MKLQTAAIMLVILLTVTPFSVAQSGGRSGGSSGRGVSGGSSGRSVSASKLREQQRLLELQRQQFIEQQQQLFQQQEQLQAEELKRRAEAFATVTFKSKDDLTITADTYTVSDDRQTPFVVLLHQAKWSRGEYQEIGHILNRLGFNCMAVDLRSGKKVNGIINETAKEARKLKKDRTLIDTEQDILAAIGWAKENKASGRVILWGSSYSSSLALRLAAEDSKLVDGVIAFSPGEYFQKFDKPKTWIQESSQNIQVPTFLASSKREFKNWKDIFEAIPGDGKTKFTPNAKSQRGSQALWPRSPESQQYWFAVKTFLDQYQTNNINQTSQLSN